MFHSEKSVDAGAARLRKQVRHLLRQQRMPRQIGVGVHNVGGRRLCRAQQRHITALQIGDLIRAMRGESAPLVDAAEGKKALQIIQAIYEASAQLCTGEK